MLSAAAAPSQPFGPDVPAAEGSNVSTTNPFSAEFLVTYIVALLVTCACFMALPSIAEEGHFPVTVEPCEMFLLDPPRNSYGCDCTSAKPNGHFIARDILGFHFPIAVPDSTRYPIRRDSPFGTEFDIRCLRIPDYPYREGEAAVGVYLVGRDEWSLMLEWVRDNRPEKWQRMIERDGATPTIAPALSPVLWSRVATQSIVGRVGFDPAWPLSAQEDSLSTIVEKAEVEIKLDLAELVCKAWIAWMATARQRVDPGLPLHPTTYYVRGDRVSTFELYAKAFGPRDVPPNSIFYALMDAMISLSHAPGDSELEARVRETAVELWDAVRSE